LFFFWPRVPVPLGSPFSQFQLYYWDYVIGVLFLSIVLLATLGSFAPVGMGALENLRHRPGPFRPAMPC
jgi:hypothetical protein